MTYGLRRDRSLRVRALDEEDDAARYQREGWDPRKTEEEILGYEGLFDRPDEDFEGMAQTLAAEGRGHDTEVAHVAHGELVVPRALQNPEVLAALHKAAARYNVPLEMLSVGNALNRINPATGAPEFGVMDWISGLFGNNSAAAAASSPTEAVATEPYRYNGPEMEEVTITAPKEPGLVQLPQTLPNEFRTYGTPANGEAQYGIPAAMHVIGQASTQWRAEGRAPFSVGNMSKSDLSPYSGRSENSDHSKGTGIDIRPIRTDGKNLPINYREPGYDREATQRLVDTLRATGGVDTIYFNDPQIKGVTYQRLHDNHLHARVNPNYQRPPGR